LPPPPKSCLGGAAVPLGWVNWMPLPSFCPSVALVARAVAVAVSLVVVVVVVVTRRCDTTNNLDRKHATVTSPRPLVGLAGQPQSFRPVVSPLWIFRDVLWKQRTFVEERVAHTPKSTKWKAPGEGEGGMAGPLSSTNGGSRDVATGKVGRSRTLLDTPAKLGKNAQCQLEVFGQEFIFFGRCSVEKSIAQRCVVQDWMKEG
jgi:hypothetical protein